jgi:hypothetical protein
MLEPGKQPPPQIVQVFEVRFPNPAQEQTLEPRHALGVVGADLGQQPM